MRTKAFALLAIFGIQAIAAIGGSLDAPPVAVTAAKILFDYAKNEAKADEIYKGKMLFITGKVDRINVGNPITIEFQGNGKTIVCEMLDATGVANLKLGNSAKVTGYCDGMRSYDISMKGCKLVR